MVAWKGRRLLYLPVVRNSVKTSFSFDAHTNLSMGSPIFFAINAANILPKLPVGTVMSIFSPREIIPFFAHICVSGEVINDLRSESAEIYGVRA